MRHPLIIVGLTSMISTTASADIIGFEVGGYAWQQSYEGLVQSGPDMVNVDQQLGLDDETNLTFYAKIEHPIPLLPNVLIQHTDLDTSASSVTTAFTFDGINFPGGIPLNTNSDLTHTDGTLYFEILDNWVSLDVGLTIRVFQEGVQISSTGGANAELDVDYTIPMLYLAAEVELPFSGLYVSADANTISYSGDGFIDYRVNVGYETNLGFGVELGYRSFDIDYEDDDDLVDVSIEGAYFGVFYHF